jgi:hypothetical protein
MIDARTQHLLQAVLRRQVLSLLQYVRDAFPWVGAGEGPLLAQVRQVMNEDLQAVGELTRFLDRKKIMPGYFGSYPMAFTSINFVSLDYVLPLLAEAQRREVAGLERDLAGVTDPEAREQVQKLLDLKRRHLATLEGVAAAHPETAVR